MKKIIFAVIVVAIILSIGIVEQIIITNTFDEMYKEANEINNSVLEKDFEQALKQTNALLEWWKKRRDYLEFSCPHNELKDAILHISELKGYLLNEKYEEAIMKIVVIQEDVMNRKNILTFKPKNIF